MSFQMTPLSEMISFGQLGKVVVGGGGGGAVEEDKRNSGSTRRENGDLSKDLPPIKKRRTDSNLKL